MFGNDEDRLNIRGDGRKLGEEFAQVLAATGVRLIVEPAVEGEAHEQ